MPTDKFSISMTPELVAQLSERGPNFPRSFLIGRELERYYALLERERSAIRRILSAGEISLICDAANGTLWQPFSIPLIAAQVEEAIQMDGLDEKWSVDGPALITKLRSLTPGQCFALVDAVERFWNSTATDNPIEIGGLL